MDNAKIKESVRHRYSKIAKQENSCCGSVESCCSGSDLADSISREIGYSEGELQAVPDGANLGLGCGNPVALASLKEGETVLDLGSGAGFDCFLAANIVGKAGRVIGIDMTPEMVKKAKENAEKNKYENVEFKLGEIEDLPIDDDSVDAIISNCVINLSPDKGKVFKETFRILKPGGRLMVSDIVLLKELPDSIESSVEAYVGCVAGAMLKDEYIKTIKAAGFQEVKIIDQTSFSLDCVLNDPTAKVLIDDLKISPDQLEELEGSILSIKALGIKPS